MQLYAHFIGLIFKVLASMVAGLIKNDMQFGGILIASLELFQEVNHGARIHRIDDGTVHLQGVQFNGANDIDVSS